MLAKCMKTINVPFEDAEFKKIQKMKEEMKKEFGTSILSWKDFIMYKLNLMEYKKYGNKRNTN